MAELDYNFIFEPIKNKRSVLRVTDCRNWQEYVIEVEIDDTQFLESGLTISSIAADILDLALAVYAADRLSIRKGDLRCNIEQSYRLSF